DLAAALLAARADAAAKLPGGRLPQDHVDPDGQTRTLLDSALATVPRPRRKRCVVYGKEESIGISWCRDRCGLVVRSVKEKDRAQEAGVRPGWVLLRVDGEVPSREPPTAPATLEFGRPVQLSDDFWHGHLGDVIDRRWS
ncbi:unnamed protein product, partial [Symbiodinium necroappetens]